MSAPLQPKSLALTGLGFGTVALNGTSPLHSVPNWTGHSLIYKKGSRTAGPPVPRAVPGAGVPHKAEMPAQSCRVALKSAEHRGLRTVLTAAAQA